MRRLIWLGIVLTVLGLAQTKWEEASALLNMAAAYKAKILCSSVFVSGRDAASVVDQEFASGELWPLRWLPATVDHAHGRVDAGISLLARQAAIYRPGFGCTLTHDRLTESVPSTVASQPQELSLVHGDEHIEAVLDWAFAEPDMERLRGTRAVVVMQDGKVVAERYAPGFRPQMPLPGWSMTKMTLNALLGIALGHSRAQLADRLDLPEWRGDDRKAITVNDLLHMSSGLSFSEEYGEPLQDVTRMLLLEPDAAAFAASKPLVAPPGTHWSYASGTSNILSRWLRSVIGTDYATFPHQALFQPLGMDSAVMEQDAAGNFVASSFMYATARDWGKLGQLYLQDGQWEGRRILPKGWVAASAVPAKAAPDQEYGAHIWLKLPAAYRAKPPVSVPAEAFHAVGFQGQFISVIPSRGVVLVRLGLTQVPDAWPQDEFISRVLQALPL